MDACLPSALFVGTSTGAVRYLAELRAEKFHGRWSHDDDSGGRWSARLHEDWRLVVTDMTRKGRSCEVHVYHAAARATMMAFCPTARPWIAALLDEATAVANEAAADECLA